MNSIRTNSIAGSQPAPWRTPARPARCAFPVICRVSTPDDSGTVALSFRPALPATRAARGNCGDWAVIGQVHEKLAELSALHCVDIQIGFFSFPSDYWPCTNVQQDAVSLGWFWNHDSARLDLALKAGVDSDASLLPWPVKVSQVNRERAA